MQEEVTQRTVALCVEATKLSAGMLQQAMKKVLDEMQKGVTGHKTKLHHGKQTLRQLMKHNTGVSNIEITDQNMQLNFRVSSEELAVIEQKMSQLGTSNREAYLRKMALDGYVVKLDLPELKELVSLMRRSSNNLNQLTRKVHETGRVYDADLKDISQRQELLWEGVKEILTQLSKLS